MSIAYQITLVEVREVRGMEDQALRGGSRWRTGNLAFLAPEAGAARRSAAEGWALATDANGRHFIIWLADHPRVRGLVIQPLDSRYCYELHPA
ncbi:MAG: hypothetical protein LDL07_01600 [Desulfarculus sp.]|nr:hypothetical protein [Desulfarculus sp.]